MIMEALFAFTTMVVLDIVWAKYTKSVSDDKAIAAASYAGAIMVANAVVTVAYVNNPWMLIPVTAGAFVGTYVAVQLGKD